MKTESEFSTATPHLGHYDIDVSTSKITFRTRHMFGLGPVRGQFEITSGSVDIAEPLAASAVWAEIDAASFRTGNPQRNEMVRSARLLNTAQFPVISFGKGSVSAADRTITGELTVQDVTRPVTLSVRKLAVSGRSFTATAALRIDRTEFGVTAMRGLAGRYLDLSIEVRCVRT